MYLLFKKINVNCGMAVLTAHLSGVIPIIIFKIFPFRGLFHDKA